VGVPFRDVRQQVGGVLQLLPRFGIGGIVLRVPFGGLEAAVALVNAWRRVDRVDAERDAELGGEAFLVRNPEPLQRAFLGDKSGMAFLSLPVLALPAREGRLGVRGPLPE